MYVHMGHETLIFLSFDDLKFNIYIGVADVNRKILSKNWLLAKC